MGINQKPNLANLISVVLHPVLWAFYMLVGLAFLFQYLFPSAEKMLFFLGLNFLLMVAFPMVMVWVLLRTKVISSMQISDRRERMVPLFIIGLSYYFLHQLFKSLMYPQSFQLFFLGATFMVLVCMMITSFWKISIHLLAIGGTIGALIALGFRYQIITYPIIIPFIFIAGLVGYARLKVDAHSPTQVYTGFGVGFISMFLLFVLL